MPRPGTSVIHPGMLPAIRPVAETAMTGQGRLLRPSSDEPTIDPDTLELIPAVAAELWTGPCRYQPRSDTSNRAQLAGERPMTTTSNQLTLPWSAPEVHVDDMWEMTASADPTLAGKHFRVVEVAFGELQAERHLTVEDYETPRRI